MKLKEVLQGRFLNHPLHPILVTLPIGLWVTSVIFDIASLVTDVPARGNIYLQVSFYCLLVGVLAAVPAVVTGLAEFSDIPANTRPRMIAKTHMTLNILLFLGYVIQLTVRDDTFRTAPSVSPGVFILNLIEVAVLMVSGYLGGTMAYKYRQQDAPRNVRQLASLRPRALFLDWNTI